MEETKSSTSRKLEAIRYSFRFNEKFFEKKTW